MARGAEAVAFPAVAPGVSATLLYADAELTRAITTAQDRQRHAGRDRACAGVDLASIVSVV